MSDIARPKKPGTYNGRLMDCKRALAPVVSELLVQSSHLPLDVAVLTRQVMANARLAGWGEPEVVITVAMLTRSRDDAGAPVRRRKQR
jgi:hypothetical protein